MHVDVKELPVFSDKLFSVQGVRNIELKQLITFQ